jgi:MFS family permease
MDESSAVAKGWLTRDVIGLSINRFLSDFGHEAATAILAQFLIAIGAPPFALGVIEGVSDGLSSFAKLFGGWLGDRVSRRRPWAALGYALTGITSIGFALATAWPAVLIARAIGWLGRGLRSPLHDALLADAVPARARGRAFGLDEAADTAGAIAGPIVALLIVGAATSATAVVDAYRLTFQFAIIPGLLAAACIMLLVRETAGRTIVRRSLWDGITNLPPSFRRYLLGVGIFGAGDFAHTLLILRATQLLTNTSGAEQAGQLAIGLYIIHNAFYALGAYPVGALADRIGKRGLLVGAYVLAALMDLLLIFATPSLPLLAIIFILGGIVYATQQSLERVVAADLVSADIRSTSFGVLASVNGIGDLISSSVVGALWSLIAPAAGFAYSLVLSLVGAVVVGWALRMTPHSG